jgi:hypothetical protein
MRLFLACQTGSTRLKGLEKTENYQRSFQKMYKNNKVIITKKKPSFFRDFFLSSNQPYSKTINQKFPKIIRCKLVTDTKIKFTYCSFFPLLVLNFGKQRTI